ncbi:hypothetical protein [Ralstonia chuxiongensis]|uniref:Uncharacterized protein n=1 Tax=Ralstonia chuxiongensis TaxID=2957504 RepID=A0AA41WSV4_9RALS|nr:hypothetical protein [Ralstonia chuxiongensis]MCP1174356.1 hypothetical protein [Ralstonia chuxiongensis]
MDDLNDDIARWKWNVTHTVEFKVETTWSRVNNLARLYFQIAEAAFLDLKNEEQNPIPVPGFDEDPADHHRQEKRVIAAAIKATVFSAMACEAGIYDLAAIQLGDKYATKVLDRLDVIGKWLVVPRLICGKSLDPDGPAINGLRSLVPARNKLVHPKSLPGFTDPSDEKQLQAVIDEGNEQMSQIISAAAPAVQAVILLSLELNRVMGTPTGALPFFERDVYSIDERPVGCPMNDLILQCRQIDAKAARKDVQKKHGT